MGRVVAAWPGSWGRLVLGRVGASECWRRRRMIAWWPGMGLPVGAVASVGWQGGVVSRVGWAVVALPGWSEPVLALLAAVVVAAVLGAVGGVVPEMGEGWWSSGGTGDSWWWSVRYCPFGPCTDGIVVPQSPRLCCPIWWGGGRSDFGRTLCRRGVGGIGLWCVRPIGSGLGTGVA